MKAQIAGKALIITSDIKSKDIARAQKICPNALVLMDEDKYVTFSVAQVAKNGDVGKYGVQFDTEGPGGKAQLTIVLDKALSKDELADCYGAALISLAEVETKFNTEFANATGKLAAVIANVEGVE